MSLDVGLLFLRLLRAFVLFAHARQRLAGWFSGPGLDRAASVLLAIRGSNGSCWRWCPARSPSPARAPWSAATAGVVPWAGADGAPTAATGVVAVAIALLAAVVPIGRMVRFDAAPSRAGADSNTLTVSRGRAHHRLLNLVATAQPGVRDVENEFVSPLDDVGRAAFTAGPAQVAAAAVAGAHVDASGPVPARRSR
jgi:hypothetical protein